MITKLDAAKKYFNKTKTKKCTSTLVNSIFAR